MRRVPVVDLFSGPGGLAEGFSACRESDDRRSYRVVLSIEKDPAAHRTLRLRAFLHKFPTAFPPEYYDFLNGTVKEEPDWERNHPERWAEACDETRWLELGTDEASGFLRERIERIREEHGDRTVLVGGPPCQAYSVIGRSRNAGNAGYKADEDSRQSLYEQYVQVLGQLRPVVAVMENVKGMLSARRNGTPIFPKILRSLRRAGDGYRLFALAPRSTRMLDDEPEPADYLVYADEHGVPQTRQRVFVVCVRRDVADALPAESELRIERRSAKVSVSDLIGEMPKLRSRLSRDDDSGAWQAAVRDACELIVENLPPMTPEEECRFRRAVACAQAATRRSAPPFRGARGNCVLPPDCPLDLQDWIRDDRLLVLPNNETRSHMPADLARYLFAAAFAAALRRSPRTSDFPDALVPAHANWGTGKFEDRYRVQLADRPSTTVTSHVAKDGHYFIHPDPVQCRSLTVREVARLQTFPDNYFFHGNRTEQYVQVGNAVPPFLAQQIARTIRDVLHHHDRIAARPQRSVMTGPSRSSAETPPLPRAAMGKR